MRVSNPCVAYILSMDTSLVAFPDPVQCFYGVMAVKVECFLSTSIAPFQYKQLHGNRELLSTL